MNTIKQLLFFLFLLLSINIVARENKISLNTPHVEWKVKPESEVSLSHVLSSGYSAHDWVKAVVPGTVFGSHVEAGLEKDPNRGDNIHQVDKSRYDRNFWYRTEFTSPSIAAGEHVFLNFESINRKGEIYLNGIRLGLLEGFMERGNFNITPYLNKTGKNRLVVLSYWPGNPIPNHASPTYISSAGWEWRPYLPGLLSSTTDDVYLTLSGAVSIIDPWVRTKSISANEANLTVQIELKNNTSEEHEGTVRGVIRPGNIEFAD